MGVMTFHCGASTVVGNIVAALVHVTVTGGGETFTAQNAELDAELVRVSNRDEDAAAVDAAASGGCATDLKCGPFHGGAVCPRGMTCRAAACAPTAHDDGGTLESLLGAEAFSESFGGACVAPRCSATECGPSFDNAVCSFGRACGSDGACVARTDADAAAMDPAMQARDTAWFIFDDGYGGVCDVHQHTTAGASGCAAPCGAAHHGAVCGPRHVCTAAGACAEDLTLGLPAEVADPSAAATFQTQYSHDFDGASYKVTASAREGAACGALRVHPAALAAAAGREADADAEAAMDDRVAKPPPPMPQMSPPPMPPMSPMSPRRSPPSVPSPPSSPPSPDLVQCNREGACIIGSQCGRNPDRGPSHGFENGLNGQRFNPDSKLHGCCARSTHTVRAGKQHYDNVWCEADRYLLPPPEASKKRHPPSPLMPPAPNERLCNVYGYSAKRLKNCPVGSQCGRNPETGKKSGLQVRPSIMHKSVAWSPHLTQHRLNASTGPGRTPGASSYTRKRLSLYLMNAFRN